MWGDLGVNDAPYTRQHHKMQHKAQGSTESNRMAGHTAAQQQNGSGVCDAPPATLSAAEKRRLSRLSTSTTPQTFAIQPPVATQQQQQQQQQAAPTAISQEVARLQGIRDKSERTKAKIEAVARVIFEAAQAEQRKQQLQQQQQQQQQLEDSALDLFVPSAESAPVRNAAVDVHPKTSDKKGVHRAHTTGHVAKCTPQQEGFGASTLPVGSVPPSLFKEHPRASPAMRAGGADSSVAQRGRFLPPPVGVR